MADVNHYLWQAEIFFSMSTKVSDPALAVRLQDLAEDYLTKATELTSGASMSPPALSPS